MNTEKDTYQKSGTSIVFKKKLNNVENVHTA